MLYPVYVYIGDESHAHGVTIPDFPGCFSAADDWETLPDMIQEAIELYCEGEDMDIPAPTPLEKLITHPDYEGGAWMLVDVDTSRLPTKPICTNISLSENLVQSKKCIGKTFEEFVDYEKSHKSKIATDILRVYAEESKINHNPSSEAILEFDLKISFYESCFEDLSTQKLDIFNLWDEWLSLCERYGMNEFHKGQLLSIAELIVKCGSSLQERNKLDSELLRFVFNQFDDELEKEGVFIDDFSKIIEWFDFRIGSLIPVFQIGVSYLELSYLMKLYRRNQKNMAYMKVESPWLFMNFSHQCHYYFNRFNASDIDYKCRKFYNEILLDKIIVCRNNGYIEMLSDSIYDYCKVTMKNRPALSWFLDFFVGYGEKPLRLIRLFIVYHILFLCLFFIPIFHFHGLSSCCLLEKVIEIIYFNNTTMLTIGYGDIYPEDAFTKVVVLIQQTIGFAIAGSFITLILRKMFRF